jgi:hypothetical protein
MKSKNILYLVILIALAVIAYFVTTDRGEKTTSYKVGDKKFFEIDSAKVDRLEIKTKDGNLVLVKANGTWAIVEPFRYKTVSALVENAISNLKSMEIESLVSSNPEKQESFGFGITDKAEVTVFEDGKQKAKILLGNPSASNSAYVKRVDSDNIYIADNIDRFNFVKPKLDDWRDRVIVSIPKESIKSIDFNVQGEKFAAVKNEQGTFVIGTDSVGRAFDGILNLLQKMEATEFKDTTLAEGTAFTDVVRADWGNVTEFRFLKLNTTPVKYLLQIPGDNQIYEFEEGYVQNILKKRSELIGK